MPGKPDVPVDFAYDVVLASLFEDLPPVDATPVDGQGFADDAPPETPGAPEGVGEEDVAAAEAPDGVPPDVSAPENGPPVGIPPDMGGAPELPLEIAGEHVLPEAADEEAVDRSPFARAEIELLAVSGRASHAGVETAPEPDVELPGLPTKAAPNAKDAFPLVDGKLPDVTGDHDAPPDFGPPDTNPGTGEDLPIPHDLDIHIA